MEYVWWLEMEQQYTATNEEVESNSSDRLIGQINIVESIAEIRR